MSRKSAKQKLENYMRRKAEEKEQQQLESNPDYQPRHPDDK